MTFSKALSPIGKGQLRCFECRKACAMKDGDWKDYKSQQVFLCKACDVALNNATQHAPAKAKF